MLEAASVTAARKSSCDELVSLLHLDRLPVCALFEPTLHHDAIFAVGLFKQGHILLVQGHEIANIDRFIVDKAVAIVLPVYGTLAGSDRLISKEDRELEVLLDLQGRSGGRGEEVVECNEMVKID
jgi:hypothetical protein